MSNHDYIPCPDTLEAIIRESLSAKYGDTYVNLILDGWAVDSCTANDLIMHTESAFLCEIIHSRLLPDIEKVLTDTYRIHPILQISMNK